MLPVGHLFFKEIISFFPPLLKGIFVAKIKNC